MSTAAEKRGYLSRYARQFGQPENALKESPGTDNKGPMLDRYLSEPASPWTPGQPWCAAFISSLAWNVDRILGELPKRKYETLGSQSQGAGLYSKNPRDAKIGLAASWTNIEKGGGHVEVVIEVNSNGIICVGGNTNNKAIQERNGGETAVKSYSWEKISSPAPGRRFNGYMKIWPEDNISLGQPTPLPQSVASVNYGVDNSKTINGAGSKQNVSYDQFFASLSDPKLVTNEKIGDVPKKEGQTNATNEKNNDFAEVKTIVDPKLQLDKMSLNKEKES